MDPGWHNSFSVGPISSKQIPLIEIEKVASHRKRRQGGIPREQEHVRKTRHTKAAQHSMAPPSPQAVSCCRTACTACHTATQHGGRNAACHSHVVTHDHGQAAVNGGRDIGHLEVARHQGLVRHAQDALQGAIGSLAESLQRRAGRVSYRICELT